MTSEEVREKYGELLAKGRLQEVQDMIMAESSSEPEQEPEVSPEETLQEVQDQIRAILKDTLPRLSSEKLKRLTAQYAAEAARREKLYESERDRLEEIAKMENEKPGFLHLRDGVDCPICMNRGYRTVVTKTDFGYYTNVIVMCQCNTRRKSWARIQASGLAEAIKRMTFDSFVATDSWQERMKRSAQDFVAGRGGEWFFIGGQVGCGKSHICTAICGEFLKQNMSVRYMRWAEESVRLKGLVNDESYFSILQEYKDCDVLYIDDFFKCQRGRDEFSGPSSADVRLAFQIIDYRYCARKKTVISSEWLMQELMYFDEAVSSRIYQMCVGSSVQINSDDSRNYRRRYLKSVVG